MKILLASAQFDLRLALEVLLREEPGIEIVGSAGEVASVRSLLQSSRPDLVILDWDLPGHYAPNHLLAEAKKIRNCPTMIVFGCNEGVRSGALAAGADAFVSCGDLPDDLIETIRQSRERRRGGAETAAALPGGASQAAASV